MIVNKADGHSQNHTVGNYPELIGSMEVQKVEMIELFNEHKKIAEMQATMADMPSNLKDMLKKMMDDDD